MSNSRESTQISANVQTKRKGKVYVTINLSSDIIDRKRVESCDIGGKYICMFTSANISRDYVSSKIHREGSNRFFRAKIKKSTYRARSGFDRTILEFIRKNSSATFLGPAYHSSRDESGKIRDHIIDTQIYVSGAIEEGETALEAALREIAEEIGKDVSDIKQMENRNGNVWFHATI